jgi:hypothetical protein
MNNALSLLKVMKKETRINRISYDPANGWRSKR